MSVRQTSNLLAMDIRQALLETHSNKNEWKRRYEPDMNCESMAPQLHPQVSQSLSGSKSFTEKFAKNSPKPKKTPHRYTSHSIQVIENRHPRKLVLADNFEKHMKATIMKQKILGSCSLEDGVCEEEIKEVIQEDQEIASVEFSQSVCESDIDETYYVLNAATKEKDIESRGSSYLSVDFSKSKESIDSRQGLRSAVKADDDEDDGEESKEVELALSIGEAVENFIENQVSSRGGKSYEWKKKTEVVYDEYLKDYLRKCEEKRGTTLGRSLEQTDLESLKLYNEELKTMETELSKQDYFFALGMMMDRAIENRLGSVDKMTFEKGKKSCHNESEEHKDPRGFDSSQKNIIAHLNPKVSDREQKEKYFKEMKKMDEELAKTNCVFALGMAVDRALQMFP
eukprot:CAMPEP_0113319866 /NCGR_PEP_ID=MMETSP0010_2-20120614/13895_1 /TAXON_ID=216773 ORGANISM="Corethron hystrix, Strain 308" /NCGR_SAMPLE_ID=MMETSP0010_2 /ASSEMBLY_ACC=CAM_ASM_000155 /LENGTH=397 /DNA_ID=CAMNT_0000177517 /DNA_START=54 /DNA_END=1247 /DNA_ORIENTATION=- /assembly_acc=CAM_ASM_000155